MVGNLPSNRLMIFKIIFFPNILDIEISTPLSDNLICMVSIKVEKIPAKIFSVIHSSSEDNLKFYILLKEKSKMIKKINKKIKYHNLILLLLKKLIKYFNLPPKLHLRNHCIPIQHLKKYQQSSKRKKLPPLRHKSQLLSLCCQSDHSALTWEINQVLLRT